MSHDESCHHDGHAHESKYRVWIQTLVLNGAFGASQLVIAWLWLGSISLIADGFHNLSDMFTLGMAPLAIRLLSSNHSARWTNGKKRAMNLVAFFNFITLAGVMIWAIIEAVERIGNPHDFSGPWLMVVGLTSIGVNGLTMRLLHRAESHSHHTHSLALSSALWHQMGDFMSSFVLVISAVVVSFTGWYLIDPLLTIVLAVGIILITFTKGGGWESICIVFGGTPSNIDMERVTETLFALCDKVHAISIQTEGARNKLLFHAITTLDTDGQERISREIDDSMLNLGINDVYPRFNCPVDCRHRGHLYGAPVLSGEDPDEHFGHSH